MNRWANATSHALFDRHGFRYVPYAGEGEVIRLRLPDAPLSVDGLMVRLRLRRAAKRRAYADVAR